MPVPFWPIAMRQMPQRGSWTGGPQESRVQFKPEYGPPIQRRRTTADPEIYQGLFPNLNATMRAAFRSFYITDLAGGVLSFCWRDPVLDDVAMWRILGSGERAFDMVAKGAGLHDLTLQLMRLPGAPWFAPYMRAGSNKPPQVVADWFAGIYGINGSKVAASALPAIAGTFDVYSTSSTDVETFAAAQVITAGGIPATAPALTKRRVYFNP
ncbi:MAG: hypothetical protein V4659_03860 [Pseudomonadota bacterium]